MSKSRVSLSVPGRRDVGRGGQTPEQQGDADDGPWEEVPSLLRRQDAAQEEVQAELLIPGQRRLEVMRQVAGLSPGASSEQQSSANVAEK